MKSDKESKQWMIANCGLLYIERDTHREREEEEVVAAEERERERRTDKKIKSLE